jgi:hypothetical protein
MAKLMLRITHKIDFCVAAMVEAFRVEAMFVARRKKVTREHMLQLSTEVSDLMLEDLSEVNAFEDPTPPEQ